MPTLATTLAEDLRALTGQIKRRLRDESDMGDFTPSQLAVLLRLEQHGPTTVSALARAEAMRPQSMGANIAVLEAAGLVAGAPDSKDKRQTILSLTPACREWIISSRNARQDFLSRAIETHLSPAEQKELGRAINLLKRIVAA